MVEIIKVSQTREPFWYKLKTTENILYIHYDDLYEYKIQKGSSLSEEVLDKLYYLYIFRKSKEKAINRLAIKQKSTFELKKTIKEIIYKLETKNNKKITPEQSEEIVNHIINYSQEKGYLNDYAYAENLFKKYSSSKKLKGSAYIKALLASKGINSETINKLFKEIEDTDESLINIRILINKYKKKRKYYQSDIKSRKTVLMRYLIGQGYAMNDILKTLKDSD